MAKDFIVAIEIGSSKITGIAGRKNTDGSISVLALVKEDASQCIRKGVIYNIDRTVNALNHIINKLRTVLKTEIACVFVGVGGQSIRAVKNNIIKELPQDTVITQDMIDELMDTNRSMHYPDMKVLDAIVQEYKVDAQYQLNPVGIPCQRIEGNFLNILWRQSYYKNLVRCMDEAGIAVADTYIAPITLADAVLTEAEKRSGCVLVDMGAGTTTVQIYYKNLLRHLVVLPLGAHNITKDIASLQIDESEAEKLKLKHAAAFTDEKEIDDNVKYAVEGDRYIDSVELINIVESRLEEIIANIKYQIPEEYDGKLIGGLVLTGGGSNLKNIEQAFREQTKFSKIRVAKFVTPTINSNHPDITSHNAMMNTVLGLLIRGDQNCAGEDVNENLFGEDGTTKKPVIPNNPAKTETIELVNRPAKPKPSVENPSQDKTPKTTKEKEEDKQENNEQNSLLSRMGRSMKDFYKRMMQEEE